MIGETISHYRIIDQLGEGGMGVVYLAEDTTLGRQVAMKFLSTTTKEYRARFLREARAVSALTHPNIATVFDYGETAEGKPYIVMELIKGQPLNEKLRAGSLPLPEALRIVCAIAEALGEAHRQGVVHRDVKPSNVVITDRGQVKVLDFGLVKQISETSAMAGDSEQKTLPSTRTRSDVIVGTPLYLSPEQATGKAIDGRSDLFALGAVLYECISGQSAFGGGSLIEIGAQVIHVTPVVPSKLNDHIPPELDRITMKAIEKKADARYQSADELIHELQSVLPTLQIDGHRQARTTEQLPTPRTASASALTTLIEPFRRPGPNLGIFLLAIAGVALSSWMFFRWWKPAPYKPTAVAQGWYDQGTDALRNGAFLQATKALEQAVANDDKFALAHARLAEAWFELDYADKAKDEMLKVQSLVPNRSLLAATDARYLEAINATVTRDFSAATHAYNELVKLSPNEPRVYVDLGRAYEKNEEMKNAVASYEQATTRDPEYATAFLRLGSLYARQLDQVKASAAFDRADTIYKARGNFEGQAEVSFQRGFLYDQKGELPKAREYLGHALELARTTSNDYQQVKTLQKLGDVEIDANNVAEGRRLMLEAITLAQARGIDNLMKRGLVDLGNTFLAEANYVEAEKYVKQSLDLSLQQKDLRNAARARLVLASLAERQGNSGEVASYLEQALPFYEQGGYRKELLQALALLGRAKVQRGDYEAAGQAFEKELKVSHQFGDQAQAAVAQEDLGLLLTRRGRYPEALQQFEESNQTARTLGLNKNVISTLIHRAGALARLGRYDEAHTALSEAAQVADREDAPRNLSALYSMALARIALSQRQLAEARTRSERAMAVAGTQLKRVAIAATFTSGLSQSLSGAKAGKLKCEQAVNTARDVGDPLLLAEALLTLAEAQLQSADNAAALKSALEARELAARVGSPDTEFTAWLLAARASRGTDDLNAREYAARADKLLGSFEQLWGENNYKSFLARPDIQLSRTQLSQVLAQNK
ncbi:MAG TPA: tetratricopeptide repeat protein [Pyrinomonadaceae bacterium]|nr:tetratricopeptide repeat protein [Pyrinomonadaceae bacterium]